MTMNLDSEQSSEWKLRTKNICFEGQRKIGNILNDNNCVTLLLARFRSLFCLAGPYENPIWHTGPPGYIGWRNRFLGINHRHLKRFQIRALYLPGIVHAGKSQLYTCTIHWKEPAGQIRLACEWFHWIALWLVIHRYMFQKFQIFYWIFHRSYSKKKYIKVPSVFTYVRKQFAQELPVLDKRGFVLI